jgi:hypothetical protein
MDKVLGGIYFSCNRNESLDTGNNNIDTSDEYLLDKLSAGYIANNISFDNIIPNFNSGSIFGYSSATYADYDYQTVVNELNNNRPVILRGGRNAGWWIFGVYTDGHTWVCDGYLRYIDPCWGSMLHLYMNWGWDGEHDGWHGMSNFNPGGDSYNYDTGMVYNIKP